ncbi:hypothetical protein LJC61_02805 [Ruminococcaceae bacterium OttesenSCG-928-A16]|nr:hypothetical protein [Ruminococcaceae bacterium OttesenSCG-928-A16]
MNFKDATIVDKQGWPIKTVLVEIDDKGRQTLVDYDLQKGEQLVDEAAPLDMVKPRWFKDGWRETATKKEIAAARPELKPIEEFISPIDSKLEDLEKRIAALENK